MPGLLQYFKMHKSMIFSKLDIYFNTNHKKFQSKYYVSTMSHIERPRVLLLLLLKFLKCRIWSCSKSKEQTSTLNIHKLYTNITMILQDLCIYIILRYLPFILHPFQKRISIKKVTKTEWISFKSPNRKKNLR